MDVTIQRDGLVLRGKLEKTDKKENSSALIIFHGFTGDLGYTEESIYTKISKCARESGVHVVRFDFDGHGKSDGLFSDMDVLREILDAITILKYVRSLPFVTDIYVLGHSQGGVVAGMLAGLYPDIIRKLILLAPAAALKTDACKGTCMGVEYDTNHIPDVVAIDEKHLVGGHYFRIAKNLPIYETTAKYSEKALIIHGIPDNCVDYQVSKQYHEILKDSELLLLEQLDHGLEGEDQQVLLEKITEFMKS